MALEFLLDYVPPPTVAAFLRDKTEVKVILGPVGSGKSSGCILHALKNAMEQAPDRDGIRRSRHVVVRNTMPQLKLTTIKSFLDWIPHGVLGKWISSDKTYYMRFNDVEAEVIFLALDDKDDVAKLLSLETTTAWFNEFREIDQDIFEGMTKRIGRYPSKKGGPGPTYKCIIADSNMPAVDTWLYNMAERLIDNNWAVFKQPGGRDPLAENVENLPPGYYDPTGLSDEYVRVMIDAQYGTSQAGLPVYRHTFVKSFHVSTAPLKTIHSDNTPIVVGLDAGLTPAAVIGQQLPTGRVCILSEVVTPADEKMGMERFLRDRLLPHLKNKYPGAKPLVIVDPAAAQRSQPTEETVFQIVTKAGLKCRLASTNKTELRISAVESLLGRSVNGGAGFLIDGGAAPVLVKGFEHAYRYDKKKDDEPTEKPAKNFASHVHDACQYLATHFVGSLTSGMGARKALPVIIPSAKGWT